MPSEALLALSRRLHEATDLESVMDRVMGAVRGHTRYRRAYLDVLSADGQSMEVVGYAIDDHELMRAKVPAIAVDQDPFLQLLFTAEAPVIIPDARTHPLTDKAQVEIFGNRTIVSVPMLRLAQRIGCLNTGTFAPEEVLEPTPEEVEFLVQVASLVSVVVGRLHAEQEARTLELRVRSAQRLESLGRLAGEIAHDFNNVLVSIIGNAELAVDCLGGHEAEEFVTQIQVASQRASRMTKQLLAFSRGQVLDRRPLDLAAVVQSLLPMFERLLPPQVELTTSHAAGGAWVRADVGQIEQLVMNLVLNARDALPVTGGTIVVETSRALEDRVRLEVRDDGAGMPEDVRAQIFEPFFSTKASGGTGLGLAVVASVVQQHEATIEVHSALGQGTRFEIEFAGHHGELETRDVAVSAADRGRAHILVVDDDEAIRGLVGRVLNEAGHRVGLAADGQEAVAYLEAMADVSLVITDLVMPNMSGGELLTWISQRPRPPDVMVMTGYAREPLREVEAPWLLTKPFTPSDLLASVHAALGSQPGRRGR